MFVLDEQSKATGDPGRLVLISRFKVKEGYLAKYMLSPGIEGSKGCRKIT